MNRRLTLIVITAMFCVGTLTAPVAAKSPRGWLKTPVYYLSLGTSLAAGEQLDPITNEKILTDDGYPYLLADYLGQNIKNLRHVNLGCSGENSTTFIYGGICDYPQGSQLNEAVQFLKTHGNFTGLITIDLGANDILACMDGGNINMQCIKDTIEMLADNLALVLSILREAAGPEVPIVGMNYYNPFLAFWFQDPGPDGLAVQSTGLLTYINSVLEYVYTTLFGIPVADVAAAFQTYDFTDNSIIGTPGYTIPDNVELIVLDTWMFPYGNIHPNVNGYQAIADEFVKVLPEIPVSKPPRRHIWHSK